MKVKCDKAHCYRFDYLSSILGWQEDFSLLLYVYGPTQPLIKWVQGPALGYRWPNIQLSHATSSWYHYCCCCCLLFNESHVLQPWSVTIAFRRWMIYGLDDIWWPYDNRGRIWLKFPDICLTVEENTGKILNQETDPTRNRTLTRCVRGNDVTSIPQWWSYQYCKHTLAFISPVGLHDL